MLVMTAFAAFTNKKEFWLQVAKVSQKTFFAYDIEARRFR